MSIFLAIQLFASFILDCMVHLIYHNPFHNTHAILLFLSTSIGSVVSHSTLTDQIIWLYLTRFELKPIRNPILYCWAMVTKLKRVALMRVDILLFGRILFPNLVTSFVLWYVVVIFFA